MKFKNHHPLADDPQGIIRAVHDFNNHHGPARIFYNRHTHAFYVLRYPLGEDTAEDMHNGLDTVELYRKTTRYADVTVTEDELRMMESEVLPYSVW